MGVVSSVCINSHKKSFFFLFCPIDWTLGTNATNCAFLRLFYPYLLTINVFELCMLKLNSGKVVKAKLIYCRDCSAVYV